MIAEKPIKSSIIVVRLRFLFFVCLALFPGLFAAGQVKFTAVANSKEIGLNDYLQLEFFVENARQIDDMVSPDFGSFRVVQGPMQSSGISIINGNMSQYKAISFVLQPSKTGSFTIGAATATVDGHHMRSNTITITVKAESKNSQSAPPGNGGMNPMFQPFGADPFAPNPAEEVDRDYTLKPGEDVKEKIRKNLFLKIQVDKSSCYVGEPIVATYKLYSHLNSESRVTKRPSLNGFSVYDMVDPTADIVTVEKLNGKQYVVHTIRKTQLIPLQAGTIDLDPVEVENTVHFVKTDGHAEQHHHSGNSIRDLIDQMTEGDPMGQPVDENVTLDTKPYTITVKPLPEEKKPASFNGAVGNFSVEASLPNRSVAAQDEATLHVVVKGKGNLPVITAPSVNWPSGIEAFDPSAKEDINKTVAPMTGTKSFDYLFSAKTEGHYTIPPISFSWFDPASQTYKSAATDSIDIQVTPAVKHAQKSPDTENTAVTTPSMTSRWWSFIQDHLEWVFALLLFSGVIVWFWRQNRQLKKTAVAEKEKKTETQELNIPSPTYVPAPITVIDPLQDARQFFEEGDYNSFYREINRAIWKAIARKLDNVPASELNKQNTLRLLTARGWDTHALLLLENILNECEMNLYTPDYDRNNMQQLLQQTEMMLERLS